MNITDNKNEIVKLQYYFYKNFWNENLYNLIKIKILSISKREP